MTTGKWTTCSIICWILAALAGLLVFTVALEPTSFIAALLVGVALAVFLGLVLTRLFCSAGEATGSPSAEDGSAVSASSAAMADADAEAADKAKAEAEAAAKAKAEAEAAAKAKAEAQAAEKAKAEGEAAVSSDDAVKTGTVLAGEQELADRKGSWTYDGAAKTETTETPDYDGDGVREGTNEGTRPAALDEPRSGGADDLKQIKGIGPKLEQLCNTLGFYHFDQIAAWSADEVAWVDANLKGFKGRVSRDTWVEQAKILAAGGETEFSKRVEDGDVY